eukprot:CAMPEP_0178994676 /NCGR_PEP_ID=MMETSP0795-20121207/7402_1 /TAXON_ID=88552 /ORGANISM="Amoebophrya sp., Strain Ameob2" /LENGTH=151 /DNA_ID=CAMNT_0020686895 /DNA_START=279 /DNA_END=735 /DNA_ORIENTATION=-
MKVYRGPQTRAKSSGNRTGVDRVSNLNLFQNKTFPSVQQLSKSVAALQQPPLRLSASSPLVPKSVDCSPLSLQCVDDVARLHRLPLAVVHVGHGVRQDLLQEREHGVAGLVVDFVRHALAAAAPRHPPDRRTAQVLHDFVLVLHDVPLVRL